MIRRAVATCLLLMVVLTGCFSVKSYVDPTLPKVGYGDLLARSDRRPVARVVAFHRDGEPASMGTSTATKSVRSVVEKSNLFSSLLDQPKDDVLVAEESTLAAFDKVVEGLVLNLLLDLQKEEQISLAGLSPR
jgi:hypothetical protein